MRQRFPHLTFLAGALFCFIAFLTADRSVEANGGTLRLAHGPAGPFALTVYTSPTPLHVGLADVSVAVERVDTGDLEPSARVIVHAAPLDPPGAGAAYEASHERATDPGFYAADVPLSTPGRWRLEILVLTVAEDGATSIDVDVSPAPLAGNPWIARAAGALLLAALATIGLAWRRLWSQRRGPQLDGAS
jgi:hypothetical protein